MPFHAVLTRPYAPQARLGIQNYVEPSSWEEERSRRRGEGGGVAYAAPRFSWVSTGGRARPIEA